MFKISSGFWVYLLTIFLLSLFGFYLSFRFKHPQISYDELTSPTSSFTLVQSNPCFLHLIGTAPFSPLPDGNIQANILCPSGESSPNFLKLSALPNRSIFDALNILASVNNFSVKLDNQNKIESLGDIANTSNKSWKVYVNSFQISSPLNQSILKINDVLEIKYE